MKKRTIYLLLIICTSLITRNAQSQFVSALSFGWNESHFFKPLSNIEIPMYQFNQKNPDIEKKYDMPEFFNGLYVDYRIGNPKGGMIMAWSNKHGIAKAEGIAAGETDYKVRNIKTRLNMFSWGFYFSIYKRLKMGITFDFGTFKILKKIAPKADFSTTDWETYYDKKGTGAMGMSANISYPIISNKHFQIRLQPYAQWVFIPKSFTLTSGAISNKYYYNPSNFGLTAFFSIIGGK